MKCDFMTEIILFLWDMVNEIPIVKVWTYIQFVKVNMFGKVVGFVRFNLSRILYCNVSIG